MRGGAAWAQSRGGQQPGCGGCGGCGMGPAERSAPLLRAAISRRSCWEWDCAPALGAGGGACSAVVPPGHRKERRLRAVGCLQGGPRRGAPGAARRFALHGLLAPGSTRSGGGSH